MWSKRGYRMRRLALRLLCACLAGSALSVRADLLVTSQGESLSGDLTRIVDGILVFRTSLKGQLMLPMTEVKALSTDEAWLITDAAGVTHVGQFVPDGISIATEGESNGAVDALPLATIVSAKIVPGQRGAESAAEERGWNASAAAGLRAFDGTQSGVDPLLSVSAQGVGAIARIKLQLHFDPSGGEDFPTYFDSRLELTDNSNSGWSPHAEVSVERNVNEALQVRTGLTLGARYAAALGQSGRIELLTGIGGTHGEWSRDYLASALDRRRGHDEDESHLNLLLGLRYSRELWGSTYWSGEVRFLPGLDEGGEFRAGASSSLVYPVTRRLKLRLDMLMNYDTDPVFEELDTFDTSVGASIQLDF